MLDQEQRDAVLDRRPQAAVGRIERVVEIEDPRLHMAELGQERQAGGGVHFVSCWAYDNLCQSRVNQRHFGVCL